MSDYKVGVGCAVIIFNDKNQFLLQKRLSKHRFGTYATPGGWIEFMETFEGAAKRETMEELGVEIEDVEVLGVTNNFFPDEDKHTVAIVLAGRLKKGQEPQIMEPHKCESIGWYDDWNNVPQPCFCEYNKFVSKERVDEYLSGK